MKRKAQALMLLAALGGGCVTTDKVDPAKVFVLGHSLGATCAPRLATLDPRIAGLICLAGTTQPLEEAIVEQLDYILSLGGQTREQKMQIEKLRQEAAALKGEKLTADTPAEKMPFGMTAAYLLSLKWLCETGVGASYPDDVDIG